VTDAVSSSPAVRRVKFDFTTDEVVDVSLRSVRSTIVGARRRFRWSTALWSAVSLCAAGLLSVGVTPDSFAAMSVSGLVLGGVCYAISGGVYDDIVRRRTRRIVDEHLRKAPNLTAEIELRPDGLCCGQLGMELRFFWKHATAIVEDGGDVELRFTPGLVVVRRRAFASDDERRSFLAAAREFAGAAGASPSSQ
jgi:hypothetical protein